MNNYFNQCTGYFFGSVSVFLGWFFGSFDGSLKVLLLLTIIDYITGVAGAAKKGELHSSIGFWGIIRKIMIFVVIGVAHVIGHELFGNSLMFREVVLYFYAANEGFSIIENADKIGIPIPKVVRNMFAMLKAKISENGQPQDILQKTNRSNSKSKQK